MGDLASALHPGRDVDGIAPDVVVGFPRADNSGCNGSVIYSHFQYKVIEALFVYAGQGLLELQGKLDEDRQMVPSRTVLRLVRLRYARRRHVRRADRFYFYDVLKFLLVQNLRKKMYKKNSKFDVYVFYLYNNDDYYHYYYYYTIIIKS